MDWLDEELGEYEDDYLIIDCPGECFIARFESKSDHSIGQIELYTHHPILPTLVSHIQRLGIRTSAVYLLESQFMEDKYKFFRSDRAGRRVILLTHSSGVLSAMSAMVNLEIPWINVMSKMDLVSTRSKDPASGRNGFRVRKDIAR